MLSIRHIKSISKVQILTFTLLFCSSLGLDQWVKYIMLNGFAWDSEALSIGGRALVYNTGVAFSMFSFLAESLKYIQILFLLALLLFALMSDFFLKHYIPLGIFARLRAIKYP